MKNTVTVEVNVNAGVQETYEFWCRAHPAEQYPPALDDAGQRTRMNWVVRVDGEQKEYTRLPKEMLDTTKIVRWAGPEDVVPRGEIAFDRVDTEHTRVGISLEWQRPDHAESITPLILLDGVQVSTDLREFKRDLERVANRADGWEETLSRFERL